MKKQFGLLTILLFMTFFDVISQTTVSYGYDAAGNRTSRTIILTSAKIDSSTLAKTEKVFEETFDEEKIIIYPNPTQGELRIQMQNNQNKRSALTLYSLSGRLLLSRDNLNDSNVLDLSRFSAGTYVLKITLGDKTREWKIIKE